MFKISPTTYLVILLTFGVLNHQVSWWPCDTFAAAPADLKIQQQPGPGDTLRQIGAANIEITPQHPILMSGYAARKHQLQLNVKHSLWAHALAVSDEKSPLAVLITVDNVGVPAAVRHAVVERLKDQFAISTKRVTISSTHTHGGPMLTGVLENLLIRDMTPAERSAVDDYTRVLTDKLVEVASQAIKKRQPGYLFQGSGEVGFAYNRRGETVTDHAMPLLAAVAKDGRPFAVVANYACHCVSASNGMLLTGDWAGCAVADLNERLPAVTSMVTIGCGGDQNPKDKGGIEASERQGKLLADEVIRVLQTELKPVNGSLLIDFQEIELPLDDIPTKAQWEERAAKKGIEGYHARGNLKRLASGNGIADTLVYPIQTWRFGGDLSMVFLGDEVVVDYALLVKNKHGEKTWVSAYSNDVACYVPSERVLRLGGYEGGGAMVWYDKPSHFAAGLEKKILKEVDRQLSSEPEAKSNQASAGNSRSAEQDYKDQLATVPELSPEEALKSFQVASGFRIDLAAAEPNVVDPVAMAFDADGRLFVIEMRGYSEDDQLSLGRVRLLQDLDDDGIYEKSTVFADGFSWPTAVTCTQGGILVGAAPDIWFLKDDDGDGKADQRRVVFTGFGRSNVQGLMNTLKWGLDNRIHGVTSSSGGVVSKVIDGKPSEEKQQLRGRDFAIEPLTMTLTAISGGGQHGMSMNAWGETFTCSNSDHLQQVLFEDRYMARNPYATPPSSRRSIAADGPQAEVYRTSPVEAWREIRTYLRVNKIVPGIVEGGGRAAGYFTGATGVTIFRGDGWPSEYKGLAIVGDVGSNLIHRKRLIEEGLLYRGVRIDNESEFVSSKDIWFRPVQYANAPDGSLYVADMYREVIEHPKSLPPVIKQHLDLTNGRDRGRIYRIVGNDFQHRPNPKLSELPTAELVQVLNHPNGWHRETAARLIYERQDASVAPQLIDLAANASRPEGRIRAMYALDGLGQLSEETLLARLEDDHPRVQQHAIRLAESWAAKSAKLRAKIARLIDSPDAKVRWQLAFTLGEFPVSEKSAFLAKLMKSDGDESLFRAAIQSSVHEGAGALLKEMVTQSDSPNVEFLSALAAQIGKQQNAADVAVVLPLLGQLKESKVDLFQSLVKALDAKAGSKLSGQLAVVTEGQSELVLRQMVSDAVAVLDNEDSTIKAKLNAVSLLRFRPFESDRFKTLLKPSQPVELQRKALEVMAQMEEPRVADLIVEKWQSIGPGLRPAAFDLLTSRPIWIDRLLDALDSRELPLAEVNVARLMELKPLLSEKQQARIEGLRKSGGNSDRKAILDAYRTALTIEGDQAKGEKVFGKNCAACHQLNGKGHPIGPNLAAMKNRGAEAILVNVLNPNGEVNPQYMNYVCLTNDGRTISGIIANETATSITLIQADNKTETVLRIDIDQLRSTGVSLMPEGLEKTIDQQAMADLLKYLTQP